MSMNKFKDIDVRDAIDVLKKRIEENRIRSVLSEIVIDRSISVE